MFCSSGTENAQATTQEQDHQAATNANDGGTTNDDGGGTTDGTNTAFVPQQTIDITDGAWAGSFDYTHISDLSSGQNYVYRLISDGGTINTGGYSIQYSTATNSWSDHGSEDPVTIVNGATITGYGSGGTTDRKFVFTNPYYQTPPPS